MAAVGPRGRGQCPGAGTWTGSQARRGPILERPHGQHRRCCVAGNQGSPLRPQTGCQVRGPCEQGRCQVGQGGIRPAGPARRDAASEDAAGRAHRAAGHRGCGPPGPPTWLRPAGQGRPLRPGAGRAGAGPPLPSQPALSPGPGRSRPQGRPLPLGTAGWRGLPSWVGRPPPPEGPLLPLARNPTGFLPPRSVHPPRGRPPGASPPQDLPTSPLASPRPTALPGAKAKAARAHRCPRRVPPAPLEQQPPAHAGPAPAPPRPRPGPLRPRPVAVLAAAARGSGPSVLQGRGGGSEPGGAARWPRRGSAGPAATRGCGTELREETRSVAKCFKT